MRRKTLLLVLTVLVILSPFIGLPYSVLMILLPVLGALILLVTFLRRSSSVSPDHGSAPTL